MITMRKIRTTLSIVLGVILLGGGAIGVEQMVNDSQLFSKNVEAITNGESFWNTLLWRKVWVDCKVEKTNQTIVTSGNVTYGVNAGKYGNIGYNGTPYYSTTTSTTYEAGRKSYCYDGTSLCASNNCR